MCSLAWGGNRCREGIIPLKKFRPRREALEEEEALEQVEAASSTPPGGTSLSVPPSPPPTLPLFCVLLTVSNANNIFGSGNRQN